MALNTAYHPTAGTFTPRIARPRKSRRSEVLTRARHAAATRVLTGVMFVTLQAALLLVFGALILFGPEAGGALH